MASFASFTNLYELSKTLRFELKPIGKTQEWIVQHHIIEWDKKRKEKYELVKPYLDKLHLDFIQHALSSCKLPINDYFLAYQKWTQDKKNPALTKEKTQEEKKLRKVIGDTFNKAVESYLENFPGITVKNTNTDFLSEPVIFAILKKKYGGEAETFILDEKTGEKASIFDDWEGWLGYFKKFFETRKNLYKTDGTATALATRIVDQNLKIFVDNLMTYQKLKEKELWSPDFDHFFTLNAYNSCLLQEGIDEYNDQVGGKLELNGKKIKGINEAVNEYKAKQKEKLPFLKKLQKQLLSKKEQKFIEAIEDELQLKIMLKDFFNASERRVAYLTTMFKKLQSYDPEQYQTIYLQREALEGFLYQFLSQVKPFEEKMYKLMKADQISGISYKAKQNSYTFPKFISLAYVKRVLEQYESTEKIWKERYYKTGEGTGILQPFYPNLWKDFCELLRYEFDVLLFREFVNPQGEKRVIGYIPAAQNIKKILSDSQFSLTFETQKDIKEYADIVRRIYLFGKSFALEESRDWNVHIELDSEFYMGEEGYFELFYENAYEEIIKAYNQMRNFIAKKPREEEKKRKLNFEGVNLLGGWDVNKESENLAIILRKGASYYLWILKDPSCFVDTQKSSPWEEKYEKMIYKYMKDVSLSIPKATTQVKAVMDHFKGSDEPYFLEKGSRVGKFRAPLKITKEIYELNNRIYDKENLAVSVLRSELWNTDDEKNYIKAFQKDYLRLWGDSLHYQKALAIRIDFCKAFLATYPSCTYFDYSSLKATSDYRSLDEFYADLDVLGYALSREELSEEAVNQAVEQGKLYLFQIYNQDFSEQRKASSKKNLHTLYFEALFSELNKKAGYVFKLNGNAEIFFRPKTDLKKLGTKKDKQGKEVVDHKRYSTEKLFFHFPIELNRLQWSLSSYAFNQKINAFLKDNPEVNVLWIDRWERNLAYFSVINQKGELLESWSLNRLTSYDKEGNPILVDEKKIQEKRDDTGKIVDYSLESTGNKVPYVDYDLLLHYEEQKRRLQRQSWREIDKIKDLKKGYVAAVVNKIVALVLKYQAIVVFEDLNMRFKQIRGGIEKSIYQQLEKALIEKLSFLVQKENADSNTAGSLFHAYQLTAPFESFKEMGKQTGIIFYTQAAYTSKIDPLTGWRPNLYLKKQDASKNKATILKFDKILFDKEQNAFTFTYDLTKFLASKKVHLPEKTVWTVSSNVERFKWNKTLGNNKGDYDHYQNLTDASLQRERKENEVFNFKELFKEYNIDIERDILKQIEDLPTKRNERFFSDFITLFALILQIRNSTTNKQHPDADFILSPVNPFFDSRKSDDFGKGLPKDGDENGAYNIARKGLIILEKINTEMSWKDMPDFFISNVEWDNFIQKK